MKELFRLGIIGTGSVATDRHLPAAIASSKVSITALVDANLEQCRIVANQFALKPKLATSVGEILQDIDGVIIATPNHSHRHLAIECLRAGVHTLIEKPMANCVEDCTAIIETGQAHNAVISVGYNTRFDENIKLMGELIRSGFFGRIRRFVYVFGTAGGWEPVSGYNLDRKSVGGGVVAVSGSHFLDRMLRWFGYPDEVEYADDSEGGPEANAIATLRFGFDSQTIEGYIRLSKTVDMVSGLVLDTDEGMVILPEGFDKNIRFRPNRNLSLNMTIIPHNNSGGKRGIYRRQLESFVAACLQGREPEVTGMQGLESVRLIQEMYAKKRPLECDSYLSLWKEISI